MKKKYQVIVSVGAAAIMAFSSSTTAMAAPEVIQVNGENTVFDCEYYAANNPDVAAACGTDREALIQHYIAYGMKEERHMPPERMLRHSSAQSRRRARKLQRHRQ